MSRFVLDNTVTMAWCFTDEATDFAEILLNRLSDLTDTATLMGADRHPARRVPRSLLPESADKRFRFL